MRTDDWLNFHVKFQSVDVNITSTTHHLKKKKKKKKKKIVCVFFVSNSKQMLTYM